MFLSIPIILFLITSISALKHPITHPTCYLHPSHLPLNTQKFSPQALLKAVSLPASCPTTEQIRYENSPKAMILGYVTPWNGHGYDIAKWFASKLTHISPVWYQLNMDDDMKPHLAGGHDVDKSWLSELRSAYRPPKIVPRVQIQLSQKAAQAILYFPQGQDDAIVEVLLGEVERYGYDGLTVEIPAPHVFTALITRIGDALHDVGKELVLVVPPMHSEEQAGMVLGSENLEELGGEVDYFSVMTYDHAVSRGVEGGNSPLGWMREVVEGLVGGDEGDGGFEDDDEDGLRDEEGLKERDGTARKILMGIPFYGYLFPRPGNSGNPEAYTASNYLEFMRGQKKAVVTFEEEDMEHKVRIPDGSTVWYPSLLSLLYRIQLAEELAVGLSIWELGQGLDMFIDVL